MRRVCRERFPRHRLQRKPLFCDPGMYHGTCLTHVPWYMLESLTPGIPGACATHNFTYLVSGPFANIKGNCSLCDHRFWLPILVYSTHGFINNWKQTLSPSMQCCFNTLMPRRNGQHATDDIFKHISSSMKCLNFRSLFLRVQLAIFQLWFR